MYVKASGKPVFDSRGKFCGYRATGTDVTAILRAQRAEASLGIAEAELVEATKVRPCGGTRIVIFCTSYSTEGARGVSATTSATHSPTRRTRKL